jgi:hypothetical protein
VEIYEGEEILEDMRGDEREMMNEFNSEKKKNSDFIDDLDT